MSEHPAPEGTFRPGLLIAGVILALAALAIGIQAGLMANRQAPLQAATLYPEPREIAGFSLVDGSGTEYAIDRWHGRWRLVFFGFTHCPDICPNTMAMLRRVIADLEPDQRPAVTFVSVDPERDLPKAVDDYARYFDPGFEGVTGVHEQLTALTRQLGVVYHIEDHETGDLDYAVDHSSAILLVDPDARLRGAFTAPHDGAAMVADLKALTERRG